MRSMTLACALVLIPGLAWAQPLDPLLDRLLGQGWRGRQGQDLPSASSHLPADQWGDYSAGSAFDGDPRTSWAEAADGPGIGEALAFVLSPLTGALEVLPGYGASGSFERNHRVKTATLFVYEMSSSSPTDYDMGSTSAQLVSQKVVSFADRMEMQSVDVSDAIPRGLLLGIDDTELRTWYKHWFLAVMRVESVYPGSRYDDTCIAEIRQVYRQDWIRFFDAIERGDVQTVTEMLRSGEYAAIRTDSGRSPLELAILTGDNERIASALVAAGASTKDALALAIREGSMRVARLLVEHDASPKALWAAVLADSRELAIAVVEAGIGSGKGVRGEYGEAIRNSSYDLTCFTSPVWDDVKQGMEVLHFVILTRQGVEYLRQLLAAGLEVDVRSAAGFTPLHYACALGDVEAAALLLERGADVNAPAEAVVSLHGVPDWQGNGVTPLYFAVQAGDTALVQLLLDRGAAVNVITGSRDPPGFAELTPLQIAERNERADLARLLRSYGADPGIKPPDVEGGEVG